jgi:hypothetical protein
MRWLVEYFATIGLAYYAYAVIAHAMHDTSLFAIVGLVGTVVFLIKHYGREFTLGLGRIISNWGQALQRFGAFLLGLPDIVRGFFNPPKSDSRVDRLAWEIRFDRRMMRAFLATFLIVVGALLITWVSNPIVREAKIDRIFPPPAPLPFDKKWMAPGEPKGVGGEVFPEVTHPQPLAVLPEAPSTQPQQHVAPSKKLRVQSGERRMKDPWDFPRF